MFSKKFSLIISLAIVAVVNSTATAGKPLKVFILAGQSNMQGKARVRTIERLNMTEDGKQMYEDIMGEDSSPAPVKGVYSIYFTGGRSGPSVFKGPLQPGYEGEITPDSSFGPEYTFGIYMQEHLNEPFLIIKTAWGGKNLLQQFRPPSAGELPFDEAKAKKLKAEGALDAAVAEHKKKTGEYYRLMMQHVNEVLADPGTYHPAYNDEDGYEIAGFVWFQGFNDLVGPYPRVDPTKGKKSPKDFSEYSRLMACFIRDVRKDVKAPEMPFVIGAIGIGGPTEDTENQQYWLRKAQEAPAALPEFKGDVTAVRTEHCWDMELQRIHDKVNGAVRKKALADNPELEKKPAAMRNAVSRLKKTMTPEVLTAEELNFMKAGQSNAEYHYMGSAYTYGKIGKAFADALVEMGGEK